MSKIAGALEAIRTRLNESFAAADPRPGDWVILSNICDQNGKPYDTAKDKLLMVLANVQRDTPARTSNPATAVRPDQSALPTPPLYIDVFVLFYANFSESTYAEGLRVISRTISFFQQNPVFTRDTLPGLDPAIDKLTFEMTNLGIADLYYLLGMFGAKYLPSVYYKVRMIPFPNPD
jgi:hypothetical protein